MNWNISVWQKHTKIEEIRMGVNTFSQHCRMYSGACANTKQSAVICKSLIENSPKTLYLKLHRFVLIYASFKLDGNNTFKTSWDTIWRLQWDIREIISLTLTFPSVWQCWALLWVIVWHIKGRWWQWVFIF